LLSVWGHPPAPESPQVLSNADRQWS
jgi:hypothetical protein